MRRRPVLRAVGSYLSVTLACGAGIIGTGMLFTAAASGQLLPALTGLPLLLIGLFWAGRALERALWLTRAQPDAAGERVVGHPEQVTPGSGADTVERAHAPSCEPGPSAGETTATSGPRPTLGSHDGLLT